MSSWARRLAGFGQRLGLGRLTTRPATRSGGALSASARLRRNGYKTQARCWRIVIHAPRLSNHLVAGAYRPLTKSRHGRGMPTGVAIPRQRERKLPTVSFGPYLVLEAVPWLWVTFAVLVFALRESYRRGTV